MSPQLTAADMDLYGDAIEEHLDLAAAIGRPTTVNGPQGPTTSFQTVTGLEAVPCSVAPAGTAPVEQSLAGGVSAVAPWLLTFPRGTDVRSADRVTVGTRRFDVVAPRRPRTYELQTRVVAKEVK